MKKDSKICPWCETVFYRKEKYRWSHTKFCSPRCGSKSREHTLKQKREQEKPMQNRAEQVINEWLYKYRPVGGGTWIYA